MAEVKDRFWYFTFMQRQEKLKNMYVKFAGSAAEARKQMMEQFGEEWGFQYSEEEFLPQIEKYGLKELV